MNAVDYQVLNSAVSWLRQGKRVVLVTVVRNWGSAPRPLGSLFAITAEGDFTGSVSGGCVEDDLMLRFATFFPDQIEVVRYGITAEQVRRFGLPCGGTLELVVEPLADASTLEPLLAAVASRRLVQRRLNLTTGLALIEPASADFTVRFGDNELVQVFGPHWRLLIIGAGQVSEYLAQMAPALDFSVYVNDPREEQRRNWQTNGLPNSAAAVEWLDGMPDDAVHAFAPDQRTVIVALSHDPKVDDMALMEALKTDAFYVGAIGSMASTVARKERLLMLDVTQEQVDRLHAPIGLPIFSRSPAEIAVSVLAELIALRNRDLIAKAGSTCAVGRIADESAELFLTDTISFSEANHEVMQ
ncbi:XdhC family protein [Glaciimonas immobilis]|uniref:Xanthine dehydrogenase accessory factor n=1 Tax=Glaciimonas immobilis TaxID=728004 RepID=A0A840RNW6_9BURK|nr:XdhC family protein [Glaciimonas immobilis]KAF3997894.1 XdhC family protein [Glaciimonas immobilis]MBB5199453.1 xanthine dehydrogenase accessory factor [Glaciimonas immobilis]